jgi:hypothetical protein
MREARIMDEGRLFISAPQFDRQLSDAAAPLVIEVQRMPAFRAERSCRSAKRDRIPAAA